MYRFIIRVHLSNGTFQDLPFQAISFGQAQAQVESMYGPGSCGGVISEEYINL